MPIITTQPTFDCIQTFFADPDAVSGAQEVMLTSAEVYFKAKPSSLNNTSGYQAPGVVASICEVVNGSPDPTRTIEGSIIRVPYDRIYAFSDASVPSIFTFKSPVAVETNRFYGLVLRYEDAQYKVWINKQGDRLVGTNTASAGSGNSKDGKYYQKTNTTAFTALNDVDLKYKINVAKYQSNTASIYLTNKNYEFLTIANRSGNFRGGELVYKNVANATGTVAVTTGNNQLIGTSTTFTNVLDGDYIVLQNGSNNQVIKVDAVTNTTHMYVNTLPSFTNSAAVWKIAPVGKVYRADNLSNTLYLVNSSANSSLKFAASANLIGSVSGATANIVSVDTYSVDQFIPKLNVGTSESAAVNFQHNFAYSNGSAYIVNTSNFDTTILNVPNVIDDYEAVIVSRSTEVSEANLYANTRKSAVLKMVVNVASNSSFNVPRINTSEVDFFTHQVQISNTYLSGDIDTEVYKNGSALSKGFTKKFAFANNRFAEDLRVYVVAFRPANTNIRVYAKLHNSNDPETFDDKLWTPLDMIQNGDLFSAADNRDDLIEYEFALQQYPDTANSLPGSFTTTNGSTVLTAAGVDPTTYVTGNDLVKLYNPLIAENFMVAPVASSNSTTITLSTAVSNNNLVGSGFVVDKLRYKGTAFNNAINNNVCRYFTSTLAEVDTFDSMQFKIVFLSDTTSTWPEVDSIEAVGINAGPTQ